VLHVVSLVVAMAQTAVMGVNLLGDPAPAYRVGAGAAVLGTIALCQWMLRTGRLTLAAHTFTLLLWAIICSSMVFSGGVTSVVGATLGAVILIAGLVLGSGAVVGYTLGSIAVLVACYAAGEAGILPGPRMAYGPLASVTTLSATLLFIGMVLLVGLRQLKRASRTAREHEVALRHSEAHLSTLVHEAPLGIVSLSATGVIESFNPAAERITGRLAEDVVGRSLFDAFDVPGRAARVWRDQLQAVLAGRPLTGAKWELPTPLGEAQVVEVTARAFQGEEGVTRIQAIVQDVTEEERQLERSRALEAELRHSQRLDSVGLLAGGIAHDFNNLLTVILASIELSRRKVPADSPLVPHLEEVLLAGQRAVSLTRQLLAFSRRQHLDPRPMDLNDLVEQSQKMLRRVISEEIAIEADLNPSLEGIFADPGQIEQVLINLAVNARDAMPRGGKLTVRTRTVELGPDDAARLQLEPGPYVMLEVRDTGTGMSEAVRTRIFDPFYTTKPPGKGTGLGLSTALGIVKQSGGSMDVQSTPGAGTTFRVYFAPAPRPAARDSRPTPIPRAAARETILLAEDDDMVRRLAVRILEEAGYHVLAAHSGAHALEVARQHGGPIDMVLTDAIMPEMNGRELIDALRAQWPTLPVLVMSGYTDGTLDGFSAEGVPYLQKPFAPADLAAKVRDVLERQRRPAAAAQG
jgi:two-component system, cell cycle sensor histidine kinase and response regulator CckA